MPPLPRFAALVMPLVLAFTSVCGRASAAALDDALPSGVQAALDAAGVPADALAAIAIPQTFWARTWQVQADRPMQPGSTMKLVTAVVALDRLGPNHRGRTELLASGSIADGVLKGDLVLKGGADPELDLEALWRLLFELRQARGVHTIEGELVLDRTLFRPARIDLGLPPFDEAPERPYNVIPDALMLEGNLIAVALASDTGGAARARLVPPLEGVTIDAAAITASERACADPDRMPPVVQQRAPGQWHITLQGAFARGCAAHERLQLLDRDVSTERVVRAVWSSLGGRFVRAPGALRAATTPPGAVPIAQHVARPWGEVLRPMMKDSDNALARLLFLQLGVAAMAGDASTPTLDLARREVERWFDEHGLERGALVLDNGSGLSRIERITPRMLARLLQTALADRHAPELLAALPVAGVDGTLRRRMKGTPAEGWARLKTGTLRDVAALAGTVRDTQGDAWVVVAIINHEHAARGRPALDALVDWIARSGARWR